MKNSCSPILSALGVLEYIMLALALAFFSDGMASTSIIVRILTVATLPAWYALIFLTGALGMTTGWLGLPSGIGILIGIAIYVTLAYLIFRQLCRSRSLKIES